MNENKKSIETQLVETLEREDKKFESEKRTLGRVYEKFSEMGIETKSNYSLPLKDTIGRTFWERLQPSPTRSHGSSPTKLDADLAAS